MISSRCLDPFPRTGGRALSQARREVKDRLEDAELFGQKLFEVWINEDAPPAPGDAGWDACMKQVDESDVLLVLYNGNAGWSTAGGVGICHGEMKRALDAAPGKVRLIRLGTEADVRAPIGVVHGAFRAFVERHNLFHGAANTVAELIDVSAQTVLHAFADLVGWGVREARRGKYYIGDALEWNKLDYRARQIAIRNTLREAFIASGATHVSESSVSHPTGGSAVLFVIHGIPAAITVSAARELVGRPFLHDHELVATMGRAIGPLHVIGCNRGVTESQAVQLIGFPDAEVVSGPFGIYVADHVQMVQFVLLSNCRDETTTRQALQRFREWLDVSGEIEALVRRARSRKNIVESIAREQA